MKEFLHASYEARCRNTVLKLLRERCYDAGCLILSNRNSGQGGKYREPAEELTFERFARLLCNRVLADYRSL